MAEFSRASSTSNEKAWDCRNERSEEVCAKVTSTISQIRRLEVLNIGVCCLYKYNRGSGCIAVEGSPPKYGSMSPSAGASNGNNEIRARRRQVRPSSRAANRTLLRPNGMRTLLPTIHISNTGSLSKQWDESGNKAFAFEAQVWLDSNKR